MASLGLAAFLLGQVNQQVFNAELVRQHASLYYIVTATLMTLGILLTVLCIHETPYRRTSPTVEREKSLAGILWRLVHRWVEPWRHYNFRLIFLTRSAIILGLALFLAFVEDYFARVQHVVNFVVTTAIIAVLALGGGSISGVLSGVLSDRMRRRAPAVCVATLCMAATCFAFPMDGATG